MRLTANDILIILWLFAAGIAVWAASTVATSDPRAARGLLVSAVLALAIAGQRWLGGRRRRP